MQLVKCLTAFLLIVSLSSHAIPPSSKSWILENAPQSYLVKKGDTLWDIAGKFLHDPYRWPQVWQSNPELDDPDLIYPGDKIILSYVNGKPSLSVHKAKTHIEKHAHFVGHERVVKLQPSVRSFPAEKPIPTIPLSAIGPFLNASHVVTSYQATHCPPIVALDEDHLIVGKGDYIYVKGLSPNMTQKIFSIFRPTKVYVDPKTSEPLGTEGLILGKAQIQTPGNPARMILIQNLEEVKIGDRITETEVEKINPYFKPKYPKTLGRGQIISVFGGINQIGQYQIVVLTGGKDKSREVGDVLVVSQVYKDLPSRLTVDEGTHPHHFPPLNIGTCLVFKVFDKVSYGLIIHAKRAIYLLDEVSSP